MDTEKGELSFALNGVNLGIAYEGIPLDKPLVPCVILQNLGDSVELDTSEVKENVDSSVPVPSNITTKSTRWDSITLTWDAVEGASFYQIEMDGSKLWGASTTSSFTKKRLLPEAEHTFRVRAVIGNSVGEWSDAVEGMAEKATTGFSECAWKECPANDAFSRGYSIDEKNKRIATIIGLLSCTIIGDIPLPPNKVTSWSIKVLKSGGNTGMFILIGVAPSDINQNVYYQDYNKCGWYFDCLDSSLWSGHPHNSSGKGYGPRKRDGEYVHTGDSVGVVMDTANGELSFAVNGVNLGVAFEGIPLDKPLVPCVVLRNSGDSVELDTSEVKENVDSSIHVPSKITTKNITWDSTTLTWDTVEGASFYQIEVDGSNSKNAPTSNMATMRGLLPDMEHTFRVRAVKGNSVSMWSDAVKERTQKSPTEFDKCAWKECPDEVDWGMKYSVDAKNPRIATTDEWSLYLDFINCCTIIGNTPLPHNKVTSWSIKILESKRNNEDSICIGVAPFDIDQNFFNSPFSIMSGSAIIGQNTCGWYFGCYGSTLRSGPPNGYKDKAYGPRKEGGEYVHTGDSVGVVVDTAKGKLSFVLNGVNLGVAYTGIPLDKPLVPCVLLYPGDSVELVI